MFFRDCDLGAVIVLDCSSCRGCRGDKRECKGELTSHYWPAADGQNQVAAKVILDWMLVAGVQGSTREKSSILACLPYKVVYRNFAT